MPRVVAFLESAAVAGAGERHRRVAGYRPKAAVWGDWLPRQTSPMEGETFAYVWASFSCFPLAFVASNAWPPPRYGRPPLFGLQEAATNRGDSLCTPPTSGTGALGGSDDRVRCWGGHGQP